MAAAVTDRNLLFGMLALQMDFIDRDALIAAMHAWVLDKSRSLGPILVQQQALQGDECELLEALVQKHLRRHGDDPERSLAAVDVAAAASELEKITDLELQASLDRHRTAASLGASRAMGRELSLATAPPPP